MVRYTRNNDKPISFMYIQLMLVLKKNFFSLMRTFLRIQCMFTSWNYHSFTKDTATFYIEIYHQIGCTYHAT